MTAIAQGASGENTAVKGGGVFFDDLKVNDAVIDEQFLPRREVTNEIGVVDGNRGGGGVGIDGEDEFIADGERAWFSDGAGTDSGALGIEKEGDFLASVGGEGAELGSGLTNEVMSRVGHIEAKDFCPTVEELGEGGGFGVLGTESGDEFCSAGVRQLPSGGG